MGDIQAGLGEVARQRLVKNKIVLFRVGFDGMKIFVNFELNSVSFLDCKFILHKSNISNTESHRYMNV
jgi:hypothetical protein